MSTVKIGLVDNTHASQALNNVPTRKVSKLSAILRRASAAQCVHPGSNSGQGIPPAWFGPDAAPNTLANLGFKLAGGGAHQSKTMMLPDLTTALIINADQRGKAILDDNALGKPSRQARLASLKRLDQLFGIVAPAPVCLAFQVMWALETEGRPMLAILCALARDPTLRDGAAAILDASLGERVGPEAVAAAFDAVNPGRLAGTMAKSLSQNASSSWLQAGFLAGPIRKRRVRPLTTPHTAAFAALLAGLSGWGGARLLGSRWLDVLDCPAEDRLGLLRQAEGRGLVRIRSAGDVLEIDAIRPMAETLRVPDLVDR